ncbi:hypothetical protein AAG906_009340 [Vitis piasezkii]
MNFLHIFGLKPSTPLAILPIELTCVLILGRLVMSCGNCDEDRIDVSKDIEVIEEKSEDEKLSEEEEKKEEQGKK